MARKSMSSFDIYSWVNTTGGKLRGRRIDNIYQESDVVLVKIKADVGNIMLVEPAKRVYFTQRIKPSQHFKEGNFALLMRKYIRGLKIRDVYQVGFDRIVRIDIGDFSFVVELLPKGSGVLLDKNGIIIGTTKNVSFKDRVVRPKTSYVTPSIIKERPWDLTSELLIEKIKGYRDVIRGLILGLSIPGEVAEEIAYLAGLDKGLEPEKLKVTDAEALINSMRDIVKEALIGKGYISYSKEGLPVQATPFMPRSFAENGGSLVEYSSFDAALDDYFNLILKGSLEHRLEAEKSKLMHSIEENKLLYRKFMEEAEYLEKQAEIIGENYPEFSDILACLKANGIPCRSVLEDNRKERYAIVDYNGTKIKLYYDSTLDKAIVRLYKEAGELKSKSKKAWKSIGEMEAKLKEINSKIMLGEVKQRIRNRKREWYERYHWTITKNCYLAIGGRNSDQNESLVRKYLRDRDMFIHADVHGSPAVIVFNDGNVGEEDLIEASKIAVAYSKAWKAGIGSIDAYWVYGNQVSKSPPSGEYLAKGSFMIYGRKNFINHIEVSIFIGVALDRESLPVIISGSEDSVREQSLIYAKIVPGNLGQKDLSEKIKREFSKNLNGDPQLLILGMDEGEIASRLPGKSSIFYVKKGENKGLKRPKGI
ncbi:MAG: NFACT family protein [Caldisphaeraceae archaeon]|nr:NFACT family protein [Caldisphaeraceae archaeon]